MWHQQITQASEAQERVVQAGVAFPADREPAEVVQPGERSFHHPAHAAESQAVVGAAADDHRFHASAPQLATVLVVVNSRDRRSQGRTATSWPSARATDVWRRPAPSSGSPWPPRKGRRPAPSAVTPGKRAQSPGKRGRRTHGPNPGSSLQTSQFRRDGRTTENRGVLGSSPGLAIRVAAGSLAFRRAVPALEKATKRRWRGKSERRARSTAVRL